jgi:uncharacterized protein YgbK (DUF1537 family)
MPNMLLGIIADDFTGASDIANNLAKGFGGHGGLRTAQYLGVPSRIADKDIEAGVIALKSRSIPAHDAVSQSLEALSWLRMQGCRQFVFKYCSTFDSTPDGNIGQVAEALAEALGVQGVVACPAFPAAGRSIYQGHLFVNDRLLNDSGLQHHPLNPMTDPDIRRWLVKQTKHPVGLITWHTVRTGAQDIRAALGRAAQRGEHLVIVDALIDDDLVAIGRACADQPLLTGGSGIALGLPGNFIAKGLAVGVTNLQSSVDGPAAILAGSCSGATRGQVNFHQEHHPFLAVDVDAVMNGTLSADNLVDFVKLHLGDAPLIYSSGTPEEVSKLQSRYGREAVAHALDNLFAATAKKLVAIGIRRLVVAGGETSGAVASALGRESLVIGPEIDPGVPVLLSDIPSPLALALKSGNFGSPDFFDKALMRMSGK